MDIGTVGRGEEKGRGASVTCCHPMYGDDVAK